MSHKGGPRKPGRHSTAFSLTTKTGVVNALAGLQRLTARPSDPPAHGVSGDGRVGGDETTIGASRGTAMRNGAVHDGVFVIRR